MTQPHKKHWHSTPSSESVVGQPEDAFELINKYGTYNIQPTADSGNDFPSIAQGEPKGDADASKDRADATAPSS